jgi:hypothetical protein
MFISHFHIANLFAAGFSAGVATMLFSRRSYGLGAFNLFAAALNLLAVFGT